MLIPQAIVESSGSLPDWWVVDSTPNAESVTFAGEVLVRPEAHLGAPAYGIFFQGDPGFEDNYNTYLELNHSDGTTVHYLDENRYILTAPPGASHAHIELLESDVPGNQILLHTVNGVALGSDSVGSQYFQVSPSKGIQFVAFTPASAADVSKVQMYYDDTTGAPKVHFRGKDDNGDPFTAVINLT